MASSSAAAAGPADTYDIPWVEKYRPTRVVDVVGNSDAVARLEVIARDGNMPNLILSVSAIFSNTLHARIAFRGRGTTQAASLFFSSFTQGPPGTGKTTSILALAHELLGPSYREAVLELNASDDRFLRP
jgi:replication factor C subunit 2/4